MRRALTLLIGAGVACGLAGAASSTSRDGWTQLHRPLHIPHIAPGSLCPASPPDTSFDFRSYGVGKGYGPGPAYPVFGRNPEPDHAVLEFDYPGASLYGAVRFGLVGPFLPPDELRIEGAGGHPSTTRLRTGGCYGYQIDGPGYSRVIVFEAKLRCLAAPVDGDRVRAGPFTGFVSPPYDVVDGRFRLRVGAFRDRATGLTQKIPWFLPSSYRVGASLVIHGRRLAPPGGAFTQRFAEAGSPDPDQHVFPSTLRPPSAGCWRLAFRTRFVRGYLVVRVDG